MERQKVRLSRKNQGWMSYSKDRDKHSYAGERGREGKREREKEGG